MSWVERVGLLSVTRPGELLGRHRSRLYDAPAGEQPLHLWLMRLPDPSFPRTPFDGSRRMTVWLRRLGYAVHRKRGRWLMSLMGRGAISPRPYLSQGVSRPEKSPYVRGALEGMRPNQVWATDSTAMRMRAGVLSLVVSRDRCSRAVLSRRLSNPREVSVCLEALRKRGRPAVRRAATASRAVS